MCFHAPGGHNTTREVPYVVNGILKVADMILNLHWRPDDRLKQEVLRDSAHSFSSSSCVSVDRENVNLSLC